MTRVIQLTLKGEQVAHRLKHQRAKDRERVNRLKQHQVSKKPNLTVRELIAALEKLEDQSRPIQLVANEGLDLYDVVGIDELFTTPGILVLEGV